MYKLSGTRDQLIEDGIKEGKEIGIKEGIEKGMEKKQIEIAKELLDVLDDLTISLKTKLPLEEIQKLRSHTM
ncbi:hypothetical protein AN640_08170 [Candidatus Epulonipiscium fishelsonii]|uniref:Uncharacterized protein n=1 Tax=Candidatus Epulonipiscium fishelsonii TaxID=77094 RepID=A0ACC8XE86_9FIRM|nr:hypothetical protein AN640_08170 [Epulopiscium sp. SCG-D08WGA-EpuloA1]